METEPGPTPPNTALRPDPKKLKAINEATIIDQAIIETTQWSKLDATSGTRQFLRYYIIPPPAWRVALRMWDRRRMTPSFVSTGPARSGTTMLADYIFQHPCVVLPLAKEMALYARKPTLRTLQAQFPSLSEQREVEKRHGMAITGFCHPVVPNLLATYLLKAIAPDPKLIIILRNPVERVFAHWRWEMVFAAKVRNDPLWAGTPDFPEVVRVELEAARSYGASGFILFTSALCGGFIQTSIYLPFLKALFRQYDRSSALIIDSDDFFANSSAVAKRIYSFLGLPEYEPVPLRVRNAGPPGEMDPETRKRLADFFEPLNRELFDYIGEDFGWN
jgi:hypothetical protein